MAKRSGVKQPAISKLENGESRLTLDVLSTIITSLGGEWELTVKLPDTPSFRFISNEDFEEIQKPARRKHKPVTRQSEPRKKLLNTLES